MNALANLLFNRDRRAQWASSVTLIYGLRRSPEETQNA